MQQIDEEYQRLVSDAYAVSTAQNFKYQVVQFCDFYAAHRLPVFPPDSLNIARFITMCTTRNVTFSTLANKAAAIKRFYHYYGYSVSLDDPALQLLLKACKREFSAAAKQKAPIEPGHILLIREILDFSNPLHNLFFVALVIQFFSCIRKSNLLPASFRAYSPHKHLS